MSDYVANAYVRVLPDSTGFRAVLSREVKDAVAKVPLASRSVLVVPTTTGFQTAVRTQVRDAITKVGPQEIPVTPTLTAFRANFETQLRKTPVEIPVVPDMDKFLTQLRAQVAAANQGLQVVIPVVTGDVGAVQRLDAITRSSASTQSFLSKVEDKRAVSRVRVNRALSEGLAVEQRAIQASSGLKILTGELQKVEEALAVARKKKSTESIRSLSIAQQELRSDIKFVQTEKDKIDALLGSTASKKKSTEASVQKTAAEIAEAEAAAELAQVQTSLSAIDKNRATAAKALGSALNADLPLRQKLLELNKASLPLTNSIKAAEAALSTEVVRSSAALSRRVKDKIRESQSDLKLNIQQRASLITRAAETEVLGVNVKALSTLVDVKAVERSVTRLSTLAQEQEAVARRAGATAIADQLAALRTELATRAELLVAQRASILEQAKQVSQQKLLARGAGATGLSLLGVRGATLAASASFLVGAAAVASFAKAVQGAASLETEINVFAETAGATSDQMRLAAEEARRLGADITLPAVAANDAAQAFSELAKAGLDVENSISGARGVLQLATAAQIENAEATQLTASALNAFGLAGGEATRVADLLTGAANEAQGSVSDMGIALQQSAAVARLAGVSLEDTVAFLTLLARNGLRGSDAGTSLRTALTRLINPTDKAAKLLGELNIQLRNSAGNIRADVFDQLTVALSGMEKAQRDATLAIIFGQDALRAAAILGREGAAGLDEVREATQQAGLAASLAAARTQGFAGRVEALRNTMQTVGTTIGASFLPPLAGVLESLESGISRLGESEDAAHAFGGALQGTVGAVSGFANALRELGNIAITALTPLVGLLANVAAAFGNLGTSAQTGLVGAFVAFKVIQSVDWAALAIRILYVGDAFTKVTTAVRAATVSFAAFRAATLGIGASLAAIATGPVGIAIGVAALAGGLLFLVTRESAAERATKNLTRATEELGEALAEADRSARTFQDSLRTVEFERLAVVETDLAVARARAAVATSKAARGSAEYISLTTQLRAALLNHEDAERRLKEAIEQTKVARVDAAVESRKAKKARIEEADAVLRLAEIEKIQQEAKFRFTRAPSAGSDLQDQARIISEISNSIREQARVNRETGDEFIRDIGKRQAVLANFLLQVDRMATQKEIRILFRSEDALQGAQRLATQLGITGEEARRNFISSILKGIVKLPGNMAQEINRGKSQLEEGFGRLGESSAESYNDAFFRFLRNNQSSMMDETVQIMSKPLSLGTQIAVAEAQGAGDQEILRLLRQRQQKQQDFLNRVLSDPKLRNRQDLVEKASQNLSNTNSQIESILQKQAADAEEHKQKVLQAKSDADQAILDSISSEEQRLQNNLLKAQSTKALRDDLKAQIAIRNFWRETIKRIKKTIKDATVEAEALLDARANLIRARNAVKEARDAIAEAVAEQQSKIREALELKVEFFNITGNVQGEINARRKLIAHLKKLQKEVAKGSVEYLRLKNEIAREQKAIQELEKQQKERDRSAESLIFTFLQTQQGFAANLLGNLIPSGATGGLVGGPTSGGVIGGAGPVNLTRIGPGAGGPAAAGFGGGLGGALIQNAQLSEARNRGPSQGQMSELIALNRRILQMLARIAGDTKHPEAKGSKMSARAMLDLLN